MTPKKTNDELLSRVTAARHAKAAAEREEQTALRAAAKRVLKDFRGNTQGQLQKHIARNHDWLKPLYARKKYGLYTLAWDLFNAAGFSLAETPSPRFSLPFG